jgi:hypothetical protein
MWTHRRCRVAALKPPAIGRWLMQRRAAPAGRHAAGGRSCAAARRWSTRWRAVLARLDAGRVPLVSGTHGHGPDRRHHQAARGMAGMRLVAAMPLRVRERPRESRRE